MVAPKPDMAHTQKHQPGRAIATADESVPLCLRSTIADSNDPSGAITQTCITLLCKPAAEQLACAEMLEH